ncbi:MAG: hypothetical protein U0Y68_11995 [Blastocatellia bacterium]
MNSKSLPFIRYHSAFSSAASLDAGNLIRKQMVNHLAVTAEADAHSFCHQTGQHRRCGCTPKVRSRAESGDFQRTEFY